MLLPRAASLAVLVSVSLSLAPIHAHASPAPSRADAPIEGPARPQPGWADENSDTPTGEPAGDPAVEPPTNTEPPTSTEPPTGPITPPPPNIEPSESGIEFAIPPPESEIEEPEPEERESPLAATWPDPGVAPNDGASMLVLSSTAIAFTGLAFGVGLQVGLDKQVPLAELLPSTLIPTVITLAFAGGGLYLGIKRAHDHHRWELAYRVVGEPQGAGLKVGGSFALLVALGCIPAGVFLYNQYGDVPNGATLIAVGSAAAVATPIMFVIGAQRSKRYARTGGWYRRPLPPIPGKNESRLQITPLVAPTFSGLTIGARGRF